MATEREQVSLLQLSAAVFTAPALVFGVPLAIPSTRAWLFDSSQFVPRTKCGTGWTVQLASTAEMADMLVFVCYALLSIGLFFWYRRTAARMKARDAIGVAIWGSFTLICGLTHYTGRLMFDDPCYRFDTLVRVCSAMSSIAAVGHLALVLLLPIVLHPDGIRK